MPKHRYQRRDPTHDWQELRPLLKDPAQISYEVIRPVILFGMTPKERALETGTPQSTIYYRANLFDAVGMASLIPSDPPPSVPKLDKRAGSKSNLLAYLINPMRLTTQLARSRFAIYKRSRNYRSTRNWASIV